MTQPPHPPQNPLAARKNASLISAYSINEISSDSQISN
jgi:hypothetical protein